MMSATEFNLLDEPWIRVLADAYSVREVSLIDALCKSHLYRDLAGEMPTQDIAVLRLMLAVLLTIFLRRDQDGNEDAVTVNNAVERWMALWERGRFPEELIREYLNKYRERFWLFHPETPFYQAPSANKGTEYTAAKLNGEMQESNNKDRLFPVRTGDAKNRLTYPEAARWLLYTNAYDDTSAKPKGKGLPSPGAGWLGKLGLIFAHGSNLFQTLMLNMTLLKDGNKEWGEPKPLWEAPLRDGERQEIAVPDDPPQLLTLQSRRILLVRDGNHVVGCSLLGGDFFDRQNAFAEQMTVWRPEKKGKKKDAAIVGWKPRRHDPARQIWRDFPLIVAHDNTSHQPGIVSWRSLLSSLDDTSLLEKNGGLAEFKIVSVQYGDKDSAVTDVFSDILSFSPRILAQAYKSSVDTVEIEIDSCEKIAKCYGCFAGDIYVASGGDIGQRSATEAAAREQFYYRIDTPFRLWLRGFDPSLGTVELKNRLEKWHKEAYSVARAMANELAGDSSNVAFVGRTSPKDGRHYSVPEALNRFMFNVQKISEIDRRNGERSNEGK